MKHKKESFIHRLKLPITFSGCVLNGAEELWKMPSVNAVICLEVCFGNTAHRNGMSSSTCIMYGCQELCTLLKFKVPQIHCYMSFYGYMYKDTIETPTALFFNFVR